MGQEVFYCFKCQVRVAGAELKAGKAVRYENRISCRKCTPDLLASLDSDARRILVDRMNGGPSPTGGRKTSTGRIPKVTAPAPAAGLSPAQWAGITVAVLIVLGLVAFLTSGSPPPRPDPARRDPPPSPPSAGNPSGVPSALSLARALPASDLKAKIAAYAEAVRLAEGTPLAREAREDHEALLLLRRREFTVEIAPDRERAAKLVAQDRFGEALDLLRLARAKVGPPDDPRDLDASLAEAGQAADRAFALLREKALDARRRGAAAEITQARDRVGTWGLPEKLAHFDLALREPEAAVERPWEALFDGKTGAFLTRDSQPAWKIIDGTLVRTVDEAFQSRQDFTDGEFRIRFLARGIRGRGYFYVRQGAEGAVGIDFEAKQAGFDGAPHEAVVTCKGETFASTLDGVARAPTVRGAPRSGRIQFNFNAEECRVFSLEYRPLP